MQIVRAWRDARRERLSQRGLRLGRRRVAVTPSGPGVNLVGCFQAESGLGEAARGTAAAIQAANIPHVLVNETLGSQSRQNDCRYRPSFSRRAKYSINLLHLNPWELSIAIGQQPKLLDGRYQICQWAWELPEFPDHWRCYLPLVDEIWTPSQFVCDAIIQKAKCPVRCLPHAVDVDRPHSFSRSEFGLPNDAMVFLTLYDTLSIRQRKNPEGAVEAFRRAFPNRSDVALVVKVINSREDDSFLRELRSLNDPRIHTFTDMLSREATLRLMAMSDAVVSLHRSEGFGLSLAEAMALGKPVIATNWSGNTEFMTAENSCPVDFKLSRIDRDYHVYAAGSTWAEPDLDHAAKCMRRLPADSELTNRIGHRASETIQRAFSPSEIGRQIKSLLERSIQEAHAPIAKAS